MELDRLIAAIHAKFEIEYDRIENAGYDLMPAALLSSVEVEIVRLIHKWAEDASQ